MKFLVGFHMNIYIMRMVENADGDVFVELGAWLGKSTNHMATLIKKSNKDIKFTTIDTWKGTNGEEIHQR
jgi:predicted O-methyltransferase YrrM